MIFKQLKQGIDDVFAIGNSLTQINNLKLDATNITGYATALKGLTVKQAELVLSTKGLTVAQQQAILAEAELLGVTGRLTTAELNAILVNKKRNKDQAEALLIKTGLITAETSEATATNVVTAAKLKELVQTKALTQAEADLIAAKAGVTLANQKESASFLAGVGSKIKGLGSGLKSAGTGVLALAKAHPVIAAITTALTIGTVAVGIYKKKQEEAAEAIREAYENAKTAIEEVNSTFKNTESTTKQIAEEYAELAQGVNLLSNENKKLSTEKYERFLELSNQLSTLYPSLTKNYDENGNAILDLSGDVDTIVGSLDDLIERQRALANQEIVEQMPDLFAGYTNNVADFKEQLDEAEKTKEAVQSAYDTISKYGIYTAFDINGNAKDANGDPVALKLGQYISLLETLGITAKQVNLKDSMGQIIGYKLELEDGSDIPNISGIHDAYVSQFNKTIDDVKYAKMQLDSETSSINQYLNTWLQTEFSYNQLESDGLQKAIQETLFNFDWSSLPEGIDKNDWEAVSEYLRRNVLFSINNIDDTDVSQALADIYTGALTSGELLNAISKVQEYFGEEHPISVALEPKVNDVQPLVNSVKDLLKGTEFDDKVGELSLGDLKIASELDVPLDSIESWEELLSLIQKVKDETFNNEITVLDAKSLVQGADGTEGLISEIQLLQEVLADTGNISQETYEKLLSCSKDYATAIRTENGRITLNTTKLKQVAKQRQLDTKATIKETLAIKKQEWLQWKNKIENYNGTLLDSIEAKYDDIDALQAEITQYELLVNSLDSATSAFERFKAAQSTNDKDMYDTGKEAFEYIKDTLYNPESDHYGMTNTDDYQEAMQLVAGTDQYKKLLNAKDMDEYVKLSKEVVKTLSPFFDENNAKSARKLFDEVDKIIASGDVPIADQDWADRLGISKEAFNALKQLANLYGYNGLEISESFQLDRLDDYQEKLSNVVAERKALNEIEDKSSNEYLKQEQSLKQAEEDYNTLLQENANTMTSAFANYSKTNGLINGENVTFADYVKEQFNFENTDIQGSMFALIDQADKLQAKLNTITSDKNAQKQFAEYDQLQGLIGVLGELGYQYEQTADNKAKFEAESEKSAKPKESNVLQDRIKEYQKIQKQIETANRSLLRTETGSEEFNAISSDISNLQSQLDVLREPITIEINANIADLEANIKKVTEEKNQFAKSNAGLEGTMFYTSQMNSYNAQIESDTAEKADLERTLKVIAETDEAQEKMEELASFNIGDKSFNVSATDSATSVVESVDRMKISDKSFKITASVGVSQVSGSTNFSNLGGLGGSVSQAVKDAASKVSGAGAYGTANISGHAYADGNIGTNQELKNVMVGEIQPEMVVDPRSGEYTIYQNPTMLDKLPKNAIIFNGKQTEEILKNGMTTSFGKAYVNGNVSGKAFATGTTWNIPLMTNTKTNNPAFSGNTGNTGKEVSDTIEETAEDVQEVSEEIFDWIERRIKRFQRLFDKWLNQAETAITKEFITKYYKKATSALTSLLKTQSKAYTRYMQEANNVGLEESYAKKVRNGTIDIESIKDEEKAEKINKYQEWYVICHIA